MICLTNLMNNRANDTSSWHRPKFFLKKRNQFFAGFQTRVFSAIERSSIEFGGAFFVAFNMALSGGKN